MTFVRRTICLLYLLVIALVVTPAGAVAGPPAVSVVFAVDSWKTSTEYEKAKQGVITALSKVANATHSVEVSYFDFCRYGISPPVVDVERELLMPETYGDIISLIENSWGSCTQSQHHVGFREAGYLLDDSSAFVRIIFLLTRNYTVNSSEYTQLKNWAKEEKDGLQDEGVIIAPVLLTENTIARYYLESWGYAPRGIATYGVPHTDTAEEIGEYIYQVIMAAVTRSSLMGSCGKHVRPGADQGGRP